MQDRPLATALGALTLAGVAGALTFRATRSTTETYPARVGITVAVDPGTACAFWRDPELVRLAGFDPRAFASPQEVSDNRLAWPWGAVRVDRAPGDRGVEVRLESRKRGLPGALQRERLREGLRRMKMLLETGEIATSRPHA